MKILIDLTYISNSSVAGVHVFAFRLLNGFAECNLSDKIILLATDSNYAVITDLFPQFRVIKFRVRRISKIPHLTGIINLNSFGKLLKRYNIDLLFSPYISLSSLFTKSIIHIGVFHDAQGFVLQTSKTKQTAHNLFITYILRSLTNIVTISNYAKKDILKYIHGKHIHVIYNSVHIVDEQSTIEESSEIKPPYILNVNTLEPYKNLITIVKAFNLVKDKIPHSLIVKAKKLPYWDNEIYPFLKEHNLVDRVQLIETRYSDGQMSNLYSNADLFVSPSLMEGFGFTPIEAALYNIPVICTKVSALYETTKGLLNYYDPPTDEKALSDVIRMVLTAPVDEKKLHNISEIYKISYSQKTQAQAYIKLFADTLDSSKNSY